LDVFVLARIVGELAIVVQVVSLHPLRVVGVVMVVMMVPAQLSAIVESIVDRNLLAARGLEAVTLSVLGAAIFALSMLVREVRRVTLVLLEAFEFFVDGVLFGAALMPLIPRCLLLRVRLMFLIFPVLLLRATDALFQLLIWWRLLDVLALLNFLLVLILPAFLCMCLGFLLRLFMMCLVIIDGAVVVLASSRRAVRRFATPLPLGALLVFILFVILIEM
jgi:hypothetical protein